MEFNLGRRAARRNVRVHGLQYAIDFADEVPLDDPFWQGYMSYIEEVM